MAQSTRGGDDAILDAIMRVAKGKSTVYDARLLAAAVGVDYYLVRELYDGS